MKLWILPGINHIKKKKKKVSLWGRWLHSWSMVLMDSSYLTTYYIRSYNVFAKINVKCSFPVVVQVIWRMFISTDHLFENELNCFNFNNVLLHYILQYNNTEPGSFIALWINRLESFYCFQFPQTELLLFLIQQFLGNKGVQEEGKHHYLNEIRVYWSPSALATFRSRPPFVVGSSD